MKYKDVVCLSMCDFFVTTRHEMSKIRILKLEDCKGHLQKPVENGLVRQR